VWDPEPRRKTLPSWGSRRLRPSPYCPEPLSANQRTSSPNQPPVRRELLASNRVGRVDARFGGESHAGVVRQLSQTEVEGGFRVIRTIEPEELLGIGYPWEQPTSEFPELPDPSKNQLPVGLLGEEEDAKEWCFGRCCVLYRVEDSARTGSNCDRVNLVEVVDGHEVVQEGQDSHQST